MNEPSGCCAPERHAEQTHPDARGVDGVASHGPRPPLVEIAGGSFVLGERSDLANAGDGEDPVPAAVGDVAVAPTTVTNAQFGAFVAATGYVTTAEQLGTSFVFAGLLPDDFAPTRGMVGAEWWREVPGACWRAPEGPATTIEDRADHPVVHVSLVDASAYADWCDVRLPSEVEWEYAARAGTDTVWWWGDELEPGGEHAMNVWQGTFPGDDTGADGWVGTAPADAYDPNPWGLCTMVGNVWEWTVDDFGLRFPGSARTGRRVLKGGSYLCHASYCNRYRPAGRIGAVPDTTAGNIGFRVFADG